MNECDGLSVADARRDHDGGSPHHPPSTVEGEVVMSTWICMDCGLVDPYDGDGDGIGSCDCPRCEWCGGPPGMGCCPEDEYPDWPDDVIVPTIVDATADGRYL